jgi:hypothetical protein
VIKIDQNASERISGERLKNQVEERIFITDQNTPGDLQNRGVESHHLRVGKGLGDDLVRGDSFVVTGGNLGPIRVRYWFLKVPYNAKGGCQCR